DQAAIAASGLAANPVYQGIKLQLSQAEVEVAAARRQVADREGRIAELRKMINTAPPGEAEYARLNRDYDVTRGQYQALVERLNRAKLADKAEATGVVRFEVVDPPTGSEQPVSPDRVRLILVVLLGGLAAGAGAAYVMHQLRPVFVSARQLTEVTRLPVLGVVRMTWLERHKALARHAAEGNAAAAPARTILINHDALRIAGLVPPSHQERELARQFRHIKRPLINNALGRGVPRLAHGNLIMVASAVPGEGKTFTSLNLAFSMRLEEDMSVLLVDGDVVNPRLSRILGVENEPGLLEVVRDNVPLGSAIHATDVPGLSFL